MTTAVQGMRRRLGAVRRAARVRLFGNNQSVAINLRNKLYLARARSAWRAPQLLPGVAEAAAQLRDQGYVQFAPEPGQSELFRRLNSEAEAAFADPALCTTPIEGAVRLKDGIHTLPEVAVALTPDVVQTVESYFQSYFKAYWLQIYRTMPTARPPEASFLWHVDNCPQEVVKLMVYLTDTRDNTGAFRLKPRPLSRQLIERGFWDRARAQDFAGTLEDRATTTVFEGDKGTRILFLNWGCVHRAKHPEAAHRDVAVFNLLPSTVPWDTHFREHWERLSTRDEDVCPDPARY